LRSYAQTLGSYTLGWVPISHPCGEGTQERASILEDLREYPPTRVLTQEIATVMQQATQSGCVRSFRFPSRLSISISDMAVVYDRTGVSLLVAGFRREPRTDTLSGLTLPAHSGHGRRVPLGKMTNAKTFLEKRCARGAHLSVSQPLTPFIRV